MNLAKTLKSIVTEASTLNDYLSSRGINPKFVSRDTKISHAKSALFQKWKSDRKMSEETILESSETELLAKYLNSRGINPKFATKDMKIAHSKSGEFMKWKRDHQHFELGEETDNLVKENHIAIAMGNMLDDEGSMVLSQLEQLERAISMIRSHIGKDYEKQLPAWVQAKITLATDYADTVGNYITSRNEKVTEETVNEAKMPRTTALDRWRKAAAEREIKHNNIEKQRQEKLHQDPSKVTIPVANTQKDDLTLAIDRLEKHLNKEDVGISKTKETSFHKKLDTLVHSTFGKRKDELKMKEEVELDEMINEVLGKDASAGDWIHDFVHSDNPKFAGKSKAERKKMALGAYYGKQNEEFEQLDELKKSTVFSWLKQQPVVPVRKPGSDRVSYNQKVKNHSRSWNRALDRLAGYKPTSENTLDSLAATEAPSDNSDMTNGTISKAAKMVKDLKKKAVKEETYDWEKDDKSSMEKPYGKAPKFNVTDKKGTLGDTKPEAKAVMKGGTTLTGQPRDMVEIDPSMTQRPGQDKGQSTFTSPTGKKSPSL
jgi:hypothetical protein